MNNQSWKDIKGFEGVYQISNSGIVRSLDRYLPYKQGTKFNKGSVRLQAKNNCGYLRVGLSKNKKQKHFIVHRLVAQAFIPNPNNLPQVNHIDGDKTNNHVNNLEWSSGQYNIDHSIATGLRDLKGSNNSQSKLTEEDVRKIRIRIKKTTDTLTQIAKEYNVSISIISRIKLNKSWKHVRL